MLLSDAWRWGLIVFWAMVVLGCGPVTRGAVTAEGYRHDDYGYRVVPQRDGNLLPESWKVDNFFGGESMPKVGSDYVTLYSLDKNGDGEFETKIEEFTYDLRLKNLVHDGVIFLRTIPISNDLRQKKLSVLMDGYVEQIAGAGYELVSLNQQQSLLVEKRYAAAVVAKSETKLAGRDAFFTLLDVANIDQIRVDPNARQQRVELILLHTDFVYKTPFNQNEKSATFPVVMFVGYANVPDEFEAGLKEFHDFLGRLEIDGKRGFEPPKVKAPAEKDEPPPAVEPTKPDAAPTATEAATNAAADKPENSPKPPAEQGKQDASSPSDGTKAQSPAP